MKKLFILILLTLVLWISIFGLAYTSFITYDPSGSLNLPKESANVIVSPQPVTKASLPVRINASFPSGYRVYNKAFLCDGKGLIIYPLSGNSSKSWIEGRLSGTVFLSGKGGQSAFSSITGRATFSPDSGTISAEEFTTLAIANSNCQSQKKDFSLQGSFLSIAKENNEKIYGIYIGKDNLLHYLTSTGLNKQDIVITGTNLPAASSFIKPKIALDSASNPHVIWGYNGKLFYTYYSNSWLTQELNVTGKAMAASIGVDSSNNVHIVYSISDPQRIVHSIYLSGSQKDTRIIFDELPSEIDVSEDQLGQLHFFWAKENNIIHYSVSTKQRFEYNSNYEVRNPYAIFDSSNNLYISYEGWAEISSNATLNSSMRLQSIGLMTNGIDYNAVTLDSLRSSVYPKVSADDQGYAYLAWSKGASVYVMAYDGVQWSSQQLLVTDASIQNNFASAVQGNVVSTLYEKSSGLAIANMPLSCFAIDYTQAASGRAYNPEVFSGCSRNIYLFGCKLESSRRWNCTWYYSPIEFMDFDASPALILDADLKPQTTYYFVQEYDPNILFNEYLEECTENNDPNSPKQGCKFGSNVDLFKIYDPKAENVLSASKPLSPEVKVAECGSSISLAEMKINDKIVYSYGNSQSKLTGAFSVSQSSLIKDLFEGMPASEYRAHNIGGSAFTPKSENESFSYIIPEEKNISEGIIEFSIYGLKSDAYICGSGYSGDWSGSEMLGNNGVSDSCNGKGNQAELFSIGADGKNFITIGLSGYASMKISGKNSVLSYTQDNINGAPVYGSYPAILSPNKDYRLRLEFGKGKANLNIFDDEEKILDLTSYYDQDYAPYITSLTLGGSFSPKGATYSKVLLYQVVSNTTSQSTQCIQTLKSASAITCAESETSLNQNFFDDFGIEGVSGGIGSFSADMNKGYSFETGKSICSNILLTGQNNLAIKVTDAGNNTISKSAHFVMKPRGAAKYWEVFDQEYLAGYPRVEFVNKKDIYTVGAENKQIKFVEDGEVIDLFLFDNVPEGSESCAGKAQTVPHSCGDDLCKWGWTGSPSNAETCMPRTNVDKGAYHLVTYLYSGSDQMVDNLKVSGDVGFALFCNGVLAAGSNIRGVESSEPSTLNLKGGWNRLDLLVYRDLPYSRRVMISPALSSIPDTVMNPRIYPSPMEIIDIDSSVKDVSLAKGELTYTDIDSLTNLVFQPIDCGNCIDPLEEGSSFTWTPNPHLTQFTKEVDRCAYESSIHIPDCYYIEGSSLVTQSSYSAEAAKLKPEYLPGYSPQYITVANAEWTPNIFAFSCDKYDIPKNAFTIFVADTGEAVIKTAQDMGSQNGEGCPPDPYDGISLKYWKDQGAKCVKIYSGLGWYSNTIVEERTTVIFKDGTVDYKPISPLQLGEMTGGCIKIPE